MTENNYCRMKSKLAPGMLEKMPLFYRSSVLLFLLINHVNCFAQLSSINPGRYDTTWWNRAPYRLVQTNLREIDATMDVDASVSYTHLTLPTNREV